jgi:flagellar motor switch protein FliG
MNSKNIENLADIFSSMNQSDRVLEIIRKKDEKLAKLIEEMMFK